MDSAEHIREVVERHAGMVFRLAYARTRRREDAEDIFQEVFLRLARRTEAFESDEHRKAWLIRTTANLSINLVKSAWRRRTAALPDELPEKTGGAQFDELNRALDDLPRKYRAVIHLFYYEDMSAEEIASALGLTSAAVRMRLTRARRALKDLLTEKEVKSHDPGHVQEAVQGCRTGARAD